MAASTVAAAGAIGPAALQARLKDAPPWLQDLRRAGWDAYQSLPMPDPTADEDWRRTRQVSRLHVEEYACDVEAPTAAGSALLEAVAALHREIDAEAALVASTRLGTRSLHVPDVLTAQGVTVLSLEEAAQRRPDLVRRALEAMPPRTRLLGLWHALWRGGCFVHVPPGISAHVPVVAVHAAAGDGAAVFPATVAVVERGASLTLVDVMVSPRGEERILSDAAGIAILEDGAALDHHLVQRWGPAAWHIGVHRALLARDARLRLFGATLGAAVQKTWWEALLQGPGAEADLAGICFGQGHQHLDHQSLQHHQAPHTRSRLLLKCAVRDEATSVYSGLVDVDEVAQGTDGHVVNRNLILSPGARADTVPRLEIRANDVRCGHGATAGHVDEEQRFYVMARGVPAAEAQRLIVRGFLEDALDQCPHDGVRRLVGHLVDEAVAGGRVDGVETAAEATA